MKKIFFCVAWVAVILVTACNSGDESTRETEMSKMDTDSSQINTDQTDPNVSVITPTFANLDAKISSDLKAIVDHYLHIKNALANDNAVEAANGGKAIADVMSKVDKSSLTAEQKKIYDDNEDDLREHAEHINKNAKNIAHQREHFSTMSEDIYSLAKAFGGGRTLYHDHCPMYEDNKGAMWLSETVEIKNPYMGKKMPKCGKVQEKIQ